MRLSEAQKKHRAWSERNFPDRNPAHPLAGVIEEVGELCEVSGETAAGTPMALVFRMMVYVGRLAHINLKRAQGIRKESSSFGREADTIDQLQAAFDQYYAAVQYPPWSSAPDDELFAADGAKQADAVADIMIFLLDYCSRHKIDAERNLDAVLSEVLQRDWSKARAESAS